VGGRKRVHEKAKPKGGFNAGKGEKRQKKQSGPEKRKRGNTISEPKDQSKGNGWWVVHFWRRRGKEIILPKRKKKKAVTQPI